MPVQTFPPMTKDFPSFDCDAHIAEPMEIWERAAEHLTRAELAALKTTLWYDRESDQLIVNDTVGAGIRSKEGRGTTAAINLISVAGPGMKHAIQRALNVRNLRPETALTKAQATKVAQMAHDGLARTIRPAHTMLDGDTVFALATGGRRVDVSTVGAYAADALSLAILRSVRMAAPAGGLPGLGVSGEID